MADARVVPSSIRPLDRTTHASFPIRLTCEDDPACRDERRRPDGRWIAGAIVAVFTCGLGWALAAGNGDAIWRNVGVSPMGTMFADLYPFVAAHQTMDAGMNIYASMAPEPWGRSYNYPVLWLTFMRYSESAIPLLGAGMIVAWFFALGIAGGRLTILQGLAVGILSCSPAVVLTLERANTDLIVFCLVVASVWLLGRGRTTMAWTGLTIATTLKLFPLFAFGVFLRLGWRRAWPWLMAATIATTIVCVIQREEISGVIRETPRGGIFSYGAVNWIHVAKLMFNQASGFAGAFEACRAPTIVCAALLVTVAFVSGARHAPISQEPKRHDQALDYFRTGAGVFLATFLCGSHFIYRLVFLLLCVPWLTRKSGDADCALLWGQRAGLGLLAVGLWSNPFWTLKLYLVREIALWSLATVLAWLIGRTLPACLPRCGWRRWRSGNSRSSVIHAVPV